MSRGLGRLQRFIKTEIYRVDREYRAEEDRLEAAGSDDAPKANFWLTWTEIRYLIWMSDPPVGTRALETMNRSAKRALHLLAKRGDIVRLKPCHGWPTRYLTKERVQELGEMAKGFAEAFARAEAS